MAGGIELGQAYVEIMPSAKGIKGKLTEVMGGDGEAAGSSIGSKIATVAKRAFAAAAVGKFVMSSINEGAKLQQSLGGIETMFKGSADKMKNYAAQAYKTSGLSANEYMENVTSFSAAMITSLGGNTSKAADISNMAMQDMSDNANKFGTDMQSIQMAYQGFAKQNYTMLDNLKLGYGGTKSEMERLLQDAEKLTGVHYDINKFSDVTQAIHAVQDQLGVTGTTAKEAAETISGSWGMLKGSFKDFMGQLALGGDLTGPIKNMATSAIAVLKNVIPAIFNIVVSIPKTIIQNAPAIKAALFQAVDNAIKFVENGGLSKMLSMGMKFAIKMINGVAKALPKIAATLGKLRGRIAKLILLAIPKIVSVIVRSAPALIAAIFRLFIAIKTQALVFVRSELAEFFSPVINFIKGKINAIKGAFSSGFASIAGKVRNAFNRVKNAIIEPIQTAKNKLSGIVSKIKGFFPLHIGKMLNIKIPTFHVNGGKAPWGLGGKGRKPTFRVTWHAKGGIMTKPTFLGFDGNAMHAGGEAGAEGLIPLDPFWAKLDRLIDVVHRDVSSIKEGGNMKSGLAELLIQGISTNRDKKIEQTIIINQPVKSPQETANAIRWQSETYGLAGEI